MEKSSAIFPFDLEKAKRITEGKDEGSIVTKNGLIVRILCFDALGAKNIVALAKIRNDREDVLMFNNDGSCFESDSGYDLLIELPIPAKINLVALKPFDKVLVRDKNNDIWDADLFGRITEEGIFACVGNYWDKCIPYEGNEHLLGTTNDPE